MLQKNHCYEKMICITNRHLCQGDFYERIAQIAEWRPKAIILREKDLQEEEYEQMLSKCKDICKGRVPLYAHTFIKAAKKAGVEGIHLPLPALRNYIFNQETEQMQNEKSSRENSLSGMKVGVSIHSVTEAVEAQQLAASYVTAGHIFATDCKKGIPGKGLTFLQQVCQAVTIPVYAIGGMNEKNHLLAVKIGAAGSCMMSGFMKS